MRAASGNSGQPLCPGPFAGRAAAVNQRSGARLAPAPTLSRRSTMKLYLNKTSPYARLSLVTAIEAGIAEKIEKIWIEPWDDAPELLALNPLGKIPVLLTETGTPLMESACICDFLIARARRADLLPLPEDLAAREDALRRVALGRASMDCAFGAVIERRFNNGKDTSLSLRWLRALPRAALELERIASSRELPSLPDLGDLAIAVAFDYTRFRLAEIEWKKTAPALGRLVEHVCNRPAMQSTRPD
ncbi:MAG: glutathione S-transferase [Betaproteobacteria bacterium]|nr:glutathione S-transferase [Betaproteobacteria bacterium]